MRVTNSLLFNTSLRNYQSSSQKLYDVNQQLASGLKIQNSYQDTGVYVDSMRLNSEIGTLTQASESSSKAQSFAKNTDTTLNDFTSDLDKFKTKLLQAANTSNSSTSLQALANELQSLRDQMKSLANTSINGQFLFSGSALSQKPISDDGTYNGNGESLTSLLGSGVELPYNIDGQSLFLGSDSDYNRVVSTNVVMYNQTDLHPDIMNNAGTNSTASEVYLSADDTIRDMVGDTDSTTSNDPNSVFYLSGRNTDGNTFSTKITMSSSSSVSDLLESIGQAYGNTSTNQKVDVSMNDYGQIEVKDLTTGHQTLEMNLFAAVDRSAAAGTSGNADQNNINDLIANPNVDIIAFNASNYTTINSASTIASRADINNSGTYRIGYPLENSSGTTATASTLLSDVLPSNVDNIVIGGTTLNVTATTTVQDLMSAIETENGLTAGSVRIENGQMIASDSTNTLNTTLVARDATNTAVSAFSIPDAINYTQRGFEKDGNELQSNVSQVVKSTNTYATDSTKLSEVAGVSTLNGTSFSLDFTDKNGNSNTATINLSNAGSTVSIDLNGDGDTTDANETFSILDGNGNATSADNVTYKQLNDVVSMLTSGTLPTTGVPAASTAFEEYNYAVKTAANSVEVTMDQDGRMNIMDRTASKSKIEFSMYDNNANDYSGTTSASLSFMANDSVTISNPSIDMFAQLDEMIEAVRSGTFNMSSTADDPRNMGIQNAISTIDHIADHVEKAHTQIGAYTNALTDAKDRVDTLTVNVKTVQADIIGADPAEAYLTFTQLSESYQAMLSSITKISSMSLLNYM